MMISQDELWTWTESGVGSSRLSQPWANKNKMSIEKISDLPIISIYTVECDGHQFFLICNDWIDNNL